MNYRVSDKERNLARMFIEQSGHELNEWEKCDFLWEYTTTCKCCGREYAVNIHLFSDFTHEPGVSDLGVPRQLWISRVRDVTKGRKNSSIAKFHLPNEEDLNCQELLVRDVIE